MLPNLASLWHVANLAPTRTMLTTYLGISAGLTQYVLHAFATKSPPYHVTTDDVSTPPIQPMSLRSQVTNVYAAEAVQLLSYMRHTGTAFFVPHGNENWIFKPSDTSFLPIGRMVPTITNPTLGSINSCVLTQPRARSPAPKGERHLPGSYRLVTNDVYRARFLSAPLPIGASV